MSIAPPAAMNRPPAPRDLNKLLADWALLQLATVDRFDDVVRGYDRRHQQGEVNRERLAIEAAIAAKLAQEYLVQSSSAAAAAANLRGAKGRVP